MKKEEIVKLMNQIFEKNYRSGIPRVPPHRHNKIDNLQISYSDILGAPSSLGSGGLSGYQLFTSSGTFTPPAGVTRFWVRIVGGGGGGNYESSSGNSAASGSAGDYVESLITTTSPLTVTIGTAGAGGTSVTPTGGNGGDTKVGSLAIAKGGNSSTTSVGSFILSGAFNTIIPGFSFAQTSVTNRSQLGSNGASTPFGFGGAAAVAVAGSQSNGNPGQGYGSGGSGGVSAIAGSTANGGPGAPGIAIFIW